MIGRGAAAHTEPIVVVPVMGIVVVAGGTAQSRSPIVPRTTAKCPGSILALPHLSSNWPFLFLINNISLSAIFNFSLNFYVFFVCVFYHDVYILYNTICESKILYYTIVTHNIPGGSEVQL